MLIDKTWDVTMIYFFLGNNLLRKSNLHLGSATQYGISLAETPHSLAQKGRMRHQIEMGFSVKGG